MKTSNKTNSRFSGIAVAMMVLSLVTTNLTAQKSYHSNFLAGLTESNFVINSKYEIMHAVSNSDLTVTKAEEEQIEDWMLSPESWNRETTGTASEEINFQEDEMILEDWMSEPANWKSKSEVVLTEEINFQENEMVLEDWMMETNWSENSIQEEELQIEDWMTRPASWNGTN